MTDRIVYLKEDKVIDYTTNDEGEYKEEYRGKLIVPADINIYPVYFSKCGRYFYNIPILFFTEFVKPLIKKLKDKEEQYKEQINQKCERLEAGEFITEQRPHGKPLDPKIVIELLDRTSVESIVRLREKGIL